MHFPHALAMAIVKTIPVPRLWIFYASTVNPAFLLLKYISGTKLIQTTENKNDRKTPTLFNLSGHNKLINKISYASKEPIHALQLLKFPAESFF